MDAGANIKPKVSEMPYILNNELLIARLKNMTLELDGIYLNTPIRKLKNCSENSL